MNFAKAYPQAAQCPVDSGITLCSRWSLSHLLVMASRFIINIDLEDPGNGLDLKTISYLERVHVFIDLRSFPKAISFLRDHFSEFDVYCDCTALENLMSVIEVLNNGARKVFLRYKQLKDLIQQGLLTVQDVDRVILSRGDWSPDSNAESLEKVLKEFMSPDSGVSLDVQDKEFRGWETLAAFRQRIGVKFPGSRYVSLTSNIRDDYVKAVDHGYVAIIPASKLTRNADNSPSLLPVHTLITSIMKSDRPDDLFPTVVSSERGECLGLVYSNEASIEKALQLGRGVYYSRRHGLWIKGQESGNTQELFSISVDCDADAVQFRVRQIGEGENSPSDR